MSIRWWCACAFLAVTVAAVHAQPRGDWGSRERLTDEERQQRREQQRAELLEALKLDEAQSVQVSALLDTLEMDRQTLREDMMDGPRDRETRQQIRQEMQQLQERFETRLKDVIGEEGLAAYQKYIEAQRERFRGGRDGGRGGERGERPPREG